MNNKHQRTLEEVFKIPVPSNVPWKDCEKLLIALGAEICEGEGSKIRINFERCESGFPSPASSKRNG